MEKGKINHMITTEEVLSVSLMSMGIDKKFLTSSNVTMASEKYICVRQPNSSVVIIDITTPQQPLKLSITADSTIINPTTCTIIAVKARINGTNQELLRIISVEENKIFKIIKSYKTANQVVFWKWITPKLLGLVTERSGFIRTERTVYHWSIEGLSDPEKMFDVNDRIIIQKIINYQCDPSEKWFALSAVDIEGIGQMQLFSVEKHSSKLYYGYVGALTTFEVEENNDIPSTLLCSTEYPKLKLLYVLKLNAEGTEFFVKRNCVKIRVAAGDSTSAVQISQKYGLIFVISKNGLLYVHDLATALPLAEVKISEHPIILTMDATTSGGFYAINAKGQVLRTNINTDIFEPFISNRFLQSFKELFERNMFIEATQLAVDSPRGLLRTPQTLAKFKSAPQQGGQTHPLRLYLDALLNKGKLNAFELLELSCLVIKQSEMDLFQKWLDEDKLECSEELGNLVKTVDNGIALKIFEKIKATQKALVDARTQLKEIKESLETEKEQSSNIIHDLLKVQQEMLTEIDGLKMNNAELQNDKDRIKRDPEELHLRMEEFDPSCNHLEANYTRFTHEEIKAATNNFSDMYKIGEGGHAVVYKAFLRHTTVAIKILKSESFQREREFNQEVKILSRFRHPNIVMLLGACPDAQALVYELMPNGSLHDVLSNNHQFRTLTWKMRIRIATNICSALIFLHSTKPHGVVHGDLDSSNILLDSNYMAKISDYGICRQLHQTETRNMPHHCMSHPKGYMDPEYYNTGELTRESDVYSFGIVLLELVTGTVTVGLRKMVADALRKGEQFVDASAGEWPFEEAKRLMQLGIRCSDTSRTNRPDLVKEVWDEIKSMEPDS